MTAEARFEALYAQTRLAVLGYLARRVDDPADAADLLAESYLVAWRRIADIPADAPRLWLFGVARRLLANYRRRQASEGRLADTLRARLAIDLPADNSAHNPRADTVAHCLAELSAADREMLQLAAYEQLTPAEIAVVIGRSPGATRVALHRARAALRGRLAEAGIVEPAGTGAGDPSRPVAHVRLGSGTSRG